MKRRDPVAADFGPPEKLTLDTDQRAALALALDGNVDAFLAHVEPRLRSLRAAWQLQQQSPKFAQLRGQLARATQCAEDLRAALTGLDYEAMNAIHLALFLQQESQKPEADAADEGRPTTDEGPRVPGSDAEEQARINAEQADDIVNATLAWANDVQALEELHSVCERLHTMISGARPMLDGILQIRGQPRDWVLPKFIGAAAEAYEAATDKRPTTARGGSFDQCVSTLAPAVFRDDLRFADAGYDFHAVIRNALSPSRSVEK